MLEFYTDLGLAREQWELSGGWLLQDGNGWWVIGTRQQAIEMGWHPAYLDALESFTDAPLPTIAE